jgi:DNA repair protein RadA/Sms
MLEHMVDTVLYLEGKSGGGDDSGGDYRLLRAAKNRFGSTSEVGVYEMAPDGLKDVENPSHLFLTSRDGGSSGDEGAAVAVLMEGSRPLLVEIQCLVAAQTRMARRTAEGFPLNRLQVRAGRTVYQFYILTLTLTLTPFYLLISIPLCHLFTLNNNIFLFLLSSLMF